MWDTAGEARTNSYVNISYGTLFMYMPVLVDTQELLQHFCAV